jgi:hypothetical protein
VVFVFHNASIQRKPMPSDPDAENNSTNTGDDKPQDQPIGGSPITPISLGPPCPSQTPSPPCQPPDHHERWWQDRKYVLELVGLIVLVAYTVFAGLQWWHIRWTNRMTREALDGSNSALQQTLDRMVWQIQETHEIAKQSLTQAQQTTKIATDTHDLAIAAGKQADAAKRLAELTAKQVTANQELIESQGASISVSFGKVLNPIYFFDGKPSIIFSIMLQNTGAIKATHVVVRYKAYYSLGTNMLTEPFPKQRDFCANPATEDSEHYRIFTVEPHLPLEVQINIGMDKPTAWEIIKWPPAWASEREPTDAAKEPVTDRILPIVVGCVDYQSGAMPGKHQTGFIFDVTEISADASGQPNGLPGYIHYPMNVPIDRVGISHSDFGQIKQY